MTLLHPEFLYFMVPPTVILFAFLLTQKEHIADFFDPDVMQKLRVSSKRMSLKTRNFLFFLASVLMIVALAQPVVEQGKVKVQAKSADIVIALDISDSMLAEDIYPSRLIHAKQKIIDFLAKAPKERVGVMAFAKATYLVSPLSFDFRAVHYLVDQLKPTYITEKGTDLMQLLETVGEMMGDKEKKYLFILTDGGDQTSFNDEISRARAMGITVFILGIGTTKGAPIKMKEGGFVKKEGSIIISRLNQQIADLATETGGSYIESILGDEDIDAMLGEMALKTTKQTLAEEEITQYEQLFYYPVGLAMILLLIAMSSMSARKQVSVPHVIWLPLLLSLEGTSEAGILDFLKLSQARSAYEAGDFNRSASAFEALDRTTPSPEALYDAANAHYRNNAYEKAAMMYERAAFESEDAEFQRLHNLGNAHAKQGTQESYTKAIEAYEKALAIKEETQTRENLEMVKERLKEEQGNRDEQDKNRQSDEGRQEQQDSKQNQSNADQSKDQQNSEQSDAASQPSQDRSESSKPEKKEQSSGKHSGDKDQAKKNEAETPVTQQKSNKGEEELPEESPTPASSAAADPETMSDLEAGKWYQILDDRPAGHIYQISPENQEREETDANPW